MSFQDLVVKLSAFKLNIMTEIAELKYFNLNKQGSQGSQLGLIDNKSKQLENINSLLDKVQNKIGDIESLYKDALKFGLSPESAPSFKEQRLEVPPKTDKVLPKKVLKLKPAAPAAAPASAAPAAPAAPASASAAPKPRIKPSIRASASLPPAPPPTASTSTASEAALTCAGKTMEECKASAGCTWVNAKTPHCRKKAGHKGGSVSRLTVNTVKF